MSKILNEEFNRALKNPRFFIVILLAFIIFIIGSYRSPVNEIPQNIGLHPVNRLLFNLYFGEFGFLAALLATLPFSDSFIDDLNQGFLRFIVQRIPLSKYLKAKLLTVAFSGGISLLLTLLIVFLSSFSNPTNWNLVDISTNTSLFMGVPKGPLGVLYTLNPFYYLLYLLASVFCFGAGCALTSLAISTFIHNRYIVLAGPMVFVQILSFLEQRTLHLNAKFNPLNSLLPFNVILSEGNFSLGSQLIQYAVVFTFSISFFLILARKSGENI